MGLASLEPKSKPQFVNEPPVADFDYEVNNLEVVFNASASDDPDGTVANYTWSFGDDSAGYGEVVAHVYESVGAYDVELIVKDDKGAANSTMKTVTVTRTEPPAASEPEAIIVVVYKKCLTVVLSGASSTSTEEAEIISHEWDFGDDMSGTGAEVTHTYAASGTYTITLTVTDSQGNTDSASVEVTVNKDGSPPPPPPPHAKIGPPGLYKAIEIHEGMAGKNKGMQNSLDHIRWNLESWIEKHRTT